MNKKFFLYVAAVAALVSCSDDLTLQQNQTVVNVDGAKGALVKAGLLSTANDETREFTGKGNFVWMAESVDGSGNAAAFPQIGLCWTGVNNVKDHEAFGARETANENVYTNYLYEQVGWLQAGHTHIEYNECDPTVVFNGAFYTNAGTSFKPKADVGGTYNPTISGKKEWAHGGGYFDSYGNEYFYNGTSSRYNCYYYGEAMGKFNSETKDLNLASGIFRTQNSSVFEGQYVVYFPYNPNFKKGPIMARVGTEFKMDAYDDKYAIDSENAFQLGVLNQYAGVVSGQGKEATFLTSKYSSTVQINLYNSGTTKNVRAVVLYAPEEGGIIYTQGIDASSVVNAPVKADGRRDMNGVKTVNTPEDAHTHSVYTYISDSNTGKDFIAVDNASHYSAASGYKIALPILPQEISKLQVIVMLEDYSTLATTAKAYTFKPGQAETIDVNINSLSDNGYIAVDEPSLVNAMGRIYSASGDNKKVKLLRPIDLVNDNDPLYTTAGLKASGEFSYNKNVTITADPSTANCSCKIGAALTVKAETTRAIESYNSGKKLTIEVPVIVEGTGCCKTTPAVLNAGGNNSTAVDKIAFADITNYGNTNLGSLGEQAEITFNEITNTYDDEYMKGKGFSKGSYMMDKTMNSPTPVKNAYLTFYNNQAKEQKITGKALKNWGFVDVTSTTALSPANVNGERSLVVSIDAVENNGVVDYSLNNKQLCDVLNPTAVVDVTNKIEGGVIIVSDNAMLVTKTFDNANKYSYVHTLGSGYSATTDGRIEVTSAGDNTTKNAGTWENDGVSNFLGGNLNNTQGLLIDKLNGQIGGKPINNGEKPTEKYNYIEIEKNSSSNLWKYELVNYQQRYFRGATEEIMYQTDINTGIYVAQVMTNERLAFLVKDAVEKVSVNIIEILGQNSIDGYSGYNLGNAIYEADLANYDVVINASDINFAAFDKTNTPVKRSFGCCLDVQTKTLNIEKSETVSVENNMFVRKDVNVATANKNTVIGGNVYVEKGAKLNVANSNGAFDIKNGSLIVDESNLAPVASADFARKLHTKYDIATGAIVKTTATAGDPKESWFEADQDVLIGKNGTLTSEGGKFTADVKHENKVGRNFELYGKATFERFTTTTMGTTWNFGQFNSYAGSQFERKQLGATDVYRATVNVYDLHTTLGTTTSGWPTEIPQ